MRQQRGAGRAMVFGLGAWVLALTLTAASPGADAAQRVAAKKPVAKTAVHKSKLRARKAPSRRVAAAPVVPVRLSFGHLAGLHETDDPLNLRSSVALVVDQDTDEVLFSKNPGAVLPIASITKLMTALVVLDAGLPLDEEVRIAQEDVDTIKGSRSRLHVGAQLTRGEMLHLALMSSENRAASAVGRAYPGGLPAFVSAMNAKARLLGMHDTRFADPTGLRSDNQSTAQDLARLVRAASEQPLIRELSTAHETAVAVGSHQIQYRNSNSLVRDPDWDIRVQKTGYISEAGRCVVMQAELAGRNLIMVLLDSAGAVSRTTDARRLRDWLAGAPAIGAALR